VAIPLSVAIVGSGPSGAYCARLLSQDGSLDARVDVYERLPAPFGLVRYGVAPDHLKIKSITASLAEIFENPRVRFAGNIVVGSDVSLDELRRHYDAVILACGAGLDRRLGIAGEELPGVFSATDFVSWYSGHPDAAVDRFSLTAEQAVVVGVGNVALDVARMLVRTADELRRTDVPEHVVEVLAASSIREITIVGRRSPAFAKFTSKELAELGALENADVVVSAADLVLDEEQEAAVAAKPAARRVVATLQRMADREPRGRSRSIRFAFRCRPTRFLGTAAVEAARFQRSKAGGSEAIDIPAQFVLRSIGYRGSRLADVPFDEHTGTVPNDAGRVIGSDGPVPGLYAVGWITRGPTGVIGTNRPDAVETVGALVDDIRASGSQRNRAAGDLVGLLRPRGQAVVDWTGWRAIDRAEQQYGAKLGRDRVKLHDRTRLLEAATIMPVSSG
jgi:ferredoxin/flavodoxin---NADP+ reductase